MAGQVTARASNRENARYIVATSDRGHKALRRVSDTYPSADAADGCHKALNSRQLSTEVL
jgi:hypothetical protein